MAGHFFQAVQFGQNRRRQLLAEFDAPLIERIDVPDDALRKDLVLVERHQTAQGTWRDLRHHNAVGGFIPCKELVGDQLLQRLTAQTGVRQFVAHLVFSLAFHQRFSLGEEVGEQDGVMMPDRVVRFYGSNEVAWNQLRALMDELIEGVLPVGAWFTPDDGAGRYVYRLTVTVDVLTVTLHVPLLKVSSETVHVLVI